MPKNVKTKGKKVVSKKPDRKFKNLFEDKKKNFSIGNDVQPKRDLTRYLRWPRYIKLQRQKRILMKRLKVPGAINQFSKTLNTKENSDLFKLLSKYRPESFKEKRERLNELAEKKQKGETVEEKKVNTLKCGLNHVFNLVEKQNAKLVIIASDVDPIELVISLPELCKVNNVPFAFVKSKSALGKLVNLKKCAAVALKNVNKEDSNNFKKLVDSYLLKYNNNKELTLRGTIQLGIKSQHKKNKLEKDQEREATKKI